MGLTEEQIAEPPDYLYKYRSLETKELLFRAKTIIADSELYFASRDSLNDPDELNFEFETPEAIKDRERDEINFAQSPQGQGEPLVVRKRYAEQGQAQRVELEQKLADGIQGLALLSMADGFADTKMWAHYGDWHRGICLQFETKNLSFPGMSAPAKWVKVAYSADKPAFIGGDAPGYTKPEEWEHEQEWRASRKKVGAERFAPAALTGIILGMRIAPDDEELIRLWANGSNIRLGRATVDTGVVKVEWETHVG